MFIKVSNDFINLDNVSYISVQFIKHENRENGVSYEYFDKNEIVHYFYEYDSYLVKVDFHMINGVAREYKISLDHIYKRNFDNLKSCSTERCDVEEQNKYCDILLALVTSEDDITIKIIKEINKYKSPSMSGILIDLENAILNYYKNSLDE